MPISRIDTFLRKLERRDRLSSAEAELLVDAAGDEVSFDMDSDLVREGDRPATSTLLVSGLATRYRVLSDGQRQITAIHVPGDFVDLHSLLLREMDHSVGALRIPSVCPTPPPPSSTRDFAPLWRRSLRRNNNNVDAVRGGMMAWHRNRK